jgi:hypothetical protein
LILWHNAKAENTYEAYQRYVGLFPNGKYSDKSNKIANEKLYQKIKSQGTVADYKLYLNRFPEGKHKTQVIEMIDDWNWNSIKNSNSKSDFGNYINKFPNGKYIQEANDFIEKTNYNELYKNDWAVGWWKSDPRFLSIEDSKSCTYGTNATMYYGTYTIKGTILKFNAEKFVKTDIVKVQSTYNGGGISFQYNDPLKTHTESSETASDYQANFNIDFENKTFELYGYVYKKFD